MLELKGSRALVTGASRGLGVLIAGTLAERGVDLVLAARNEKELAAVAGKVARPGQRVVAVPTDVGDRAALERLVERARAELGEIDLLVNNAGIEHSGFYEDLSLDDLDAMLRVNLGAPMWLTRLLLPDMLARDRGHIVNVSSLAGLGPNAFGEPYGATKAGLVGFTRSLRGTLQARGSKVSASSICPGFVTDTGMYARGHEDYGAVAPRTLGTVAPQAVADAVIRAVERDEAQLIVNEMPVRPFLAIGAVAPRVVEWFSGKLKLHQTLRAVAEKRREERRGKGQALSTGP
jgi:short-subunit dehydrogenase